MSTRKTAQPKAPSSDTSQRQAEAKPASAAERGTSRPETTQEERAAMHPQRHDLEWRYCWGAWSS